MCNGYYATFSESFGAGTGAGTVAAGGGRGLHGAVEDGYLDDVGVLGAKAEGQ